MYLGIEMVFSEWNASQRSKECLRIDMLHIGWKRVKKIKWFKENKIFNGVKCCIKNECFMEIKKLKCCIKKETIHEEKN